jgi:hypothetical protein
LFLVDSFIWLTGHTDCHECGNCEYCQTLQHNAEILLVEAEPVDFKLGHYRIRVVS